ncbi:MAG: leucine-rich repeat protein [Lachnospiraceae bacterium]|nr:leucine-rich repeat protein [Lachnospiraceae bacterium]
MKKNIVTVMIALCIAVISVVNPATISGASFAESEQMEGARANWTTSKDGKWIYFKNYDGTIDVCTYTGSEYEEGGDIVIPSHIDGKEVGSIGKMEIFSLLGFPRLHSITIPETVTDLGMHAFQYCTGLKEVIVKGRINSSQLGMALSECKNLETISVLGGVDLSCFEGIPITTVNILEGSESVSINNGSNPDSSIEDVLSTVHIPNGVETVRLEYLHQLKSIDMPESVTDVTLQGMYQMESLSLPSGIESFSANNCPQLSVLNCPKPTQDIEIQKLTNCPKLHIEVFVKERMVDLSGSGITKLVIDGSTWDIWGWSQKKQLVNCPYLEEIVVSGNNDYYFTVDGMLCWRNDKSSKVYDILAYPAGKSTTGNFTVPENVKCIYYDAFDSCKFSTITIPENISGGWYWDIEEGMTSTEWPNIVWEEIGSFLSRNQAKLCLVPYSHADTGWGDVEELADTLHVPAERIQYQLGSTYKISYVLNGGQNAAGNPTSYRAGEVKTLQDPTRSGYTFLGWKRNDIGDDYENTTGRNDLYQDYIFTAVWKKVSGGSGGSAPCISHTYNNGKVTKKATIKKRGSMVRTCKKCGEKETLSIPAIGNNIHIYRSDNWYDGTKKVPWSSIIIDSKGNWLDEKKDYTISYAKGMKNVGQYMVKVVFRGKYSGTVKKKITIVPCFTEIKKLQGKKKALSVQWKKKTKQVTGYEVAYSLKKSFPKKGTKTIVIKKNKTASCKISKLKSKKTYYVRVRTYKTVKINGKPKKLYSVWSDVKKAKTK